MILALLVSLVMITFISLSVFGGGQVFMPIFAWLWRSLATWFNVKIDEEFINNIFAIANSTPGILSPKFATITGYIVANGQWWGYFAMILTYLAFVIPPIFMMQIALKYSEKFSDSTFFKNLIKLMNPVVAGIIIALAIELIIGTMFPFIVFNQSAANYWGFVDPKSPTNKIKFLKGWRQIVLWIYVPIGVSLSTFLYLKKIQVFGLVLANVIIALILFQPWLN
ncbi:chromate transporter [Mycoplasma putrefaciens]|uniref:Chromate ion transporter n=1 Tax=Mycoplasma putrefaciens (strain ATCC 15718 / NCTC 10155 / C30 KS-1 / KS-1) TaxID=743965 RepID=A0A7U4E944_MYCPK|nr:chromate transporter [Mycoplasma putrefaciens]AEM68427.1 putative chromate ion transporter [Mycoplasma putrefaciens KS1]